MDDSETAERTVRYALEAYSDVEVTTLHVVGAPSPIMGKAVSLALEDDIEQAAEEHASAILQRARDIADQFHTNITTDIAWGTSANVIIDLRSSIR
jgi:nucleotide-binding universal stress UspA family protein